MGRNVKYNLDDFIGEVYGKDGRYEVVAVERKVRGNIHFKVKCNVCCQDTELFGEAIYAVRKSKIEGRDCSGVGCGCSLRPRWTEHQQIVRIKRLCEKYKFRFLGFVGNYCGNLTKLKLKCIVDDNEWFTTNVQHMLSGTVGCSVCFASAAALRRKTPNDIAIENFINTGRFLPGTTFSTTGESNRGGCLWEVTCPTCSDDEYVKVGLCSGVFTSVTSSLSAGNLPCRCSERFMWTPEQTQYRINKAIKDKGMSCKFVGFTKEGCFRSHDKVTLMCAKHGLWDVQINSFIHRSIGCPSCNTSGFCVDKPASLYVLHVSSDTKCGFAGYGITNDYKTRKQCHSRNFKRKSFYIVDEKVFSLSGSEALSIEKSIKVVFDAAPQDIEGFKTEATHSYLYNDVILHVQRHLGETSTT